MRIAVLIPCYNEEQTVAKVVDDFKAQLPQAEVYVFDNNSTDHTAAIAREHGAVVIPEYQQGKGFVIRSMFRKIDADCYVMADGDDTYPADCVRQLIEPVVQGRADMVIGDRLSSTYFTENKRPFHNFGNVLVRALINRIFHNNIHDIMTGYRAFGSQFVKSFPVLSGGFEIETEMTIFALDKRFRLEEVTVDYRDRPSGSKSKLSTFSDGFKVLKTIFNLYKNYKPFSFFSVIAAVLAVICLVLFVPVLVQFFRTGLVPRFPTLIVSIGIGTAALLSFFTGVILAPLQKQHKQMFELYLHSFYGKENSAQEEYGHAENGEM